MEEYQQPYLRLWAGITEALDALEQRNYGLAEDLLRRAQQAAEEAYIAAGDRAEA